MKKMMFNDECGLTKLTLEGIKTRTSRLATGLPENMVRPLEIVKDGPHKGWQVVLYGEDAQALVKPPYMPGERIAVARSYRSLGYDPMFCPPGLEDGVGSSQGWSNKMYVKAELMKQFIEVKGYHLERLQDISDEDIMREGVVKSMIGCKNPETGEEGDFAFLTLSRKDGKLVTTYNVRTTAREAFIGLIGKACGKDVWESNPWVWAVDYKLVEG